MYYFFLSLDLNLKHDNRTIGTREKSKPYIKHIIKKHSYPITTSQYKDLHIRKDPCVENKNTEVNTSHFNDYTGNFLNRILQGKDNVKNITDNEDAYHILPEANITIATRYFVW